MVRRKDKHGREKNKLVLQVVANGVTDVVTQLPWIADSLQHGVPELVSYLPGAATEGLSNVSALAEHWDGEQLRVAGTSVVGLFYLTAKPGVLTGALDTYLGAPIQTLIEFVRGRRNWKRRDFIIDERLGEGSFGTVYSGVIVPKSVSSEEELGRRGRRLEEFEDYKKFKRVVLKKVCKRHSETLIRVCNLNGARRPKFENCVIAGESRSLRGRGMRGDGGVVQLPDVESCVECVCKFLRLFHR